MNESRRAFLKLLGAGSVGLIAQRSFSQDAAGFAASRKQVPISIQMWSVRDLAAKDFAGTVRRLARVGYQGVELAGYGNLDVEGVKRAMDEAGIPVSGMHVNIAALRKDSAKVVEEARLLGAKNVICPSWPKDQYTSAQACRRIGEELGRIGAVFASAGLCFCFHNHAAEIAEIDGRLVLDWILDAVPPANLSCEADVFWLTQGGKAPAEFLHEQGRRVKLLHMRDGGMLGDGPVDLPATLAAQRSIGAEEWLVVETDGKAGPDPLTAAERNLRFLQKLLEAG